MGQKREAEPSVIDIVDIHLKEAKRVPLLTVYQERILAYAIYEGGLSEDRVLEVLGEAITRRLNDEEASEEKIEYEMIDRVIEATLSTPIDGMDIFSLCQAQDIDKVKEVFISANLRLVILIAKKCIGQGVAFEDLIQGGNLGLMAAVKKFDPRKGTKFSTYATSWIQQAVSRTIYQQGEVVKLPDHAALDRNKLRKKYEELLQKYPEEKITQELLAKKTGLPLKKVKGLWNYVIYTDNALSIEVADDKGWLDALMPYEDNVAAMVKAKDLKEFVKEVIGRLETDQEKEYVRLRFWWGLSGPEIAKRLNITEKAVKGLKEAVFRKLRINAKMHPDNDLLDR